MVLGLGAGGCGPTEGPPASVKIVQSSWSCGFFVESYEDKVLLKV